MDTKQLVLKRTLEAAGESLRVDTLDERLRLQKAIYLVQAAGADLGYRYSWYIRGPYSTSLTQDYFAVADLAKSGQDDDTRTLKPAFVAKVKTASQVLKMPANIGLTRVQWYELLASLHYLAKFEQIPQANLANEIGKRKPHLANYAHAGIQHLSQHQLI
ncbi:hypothetical protein [Ralstonia pseudosolanacearum]|uniref:hypothetical protein n=1 Tax=Ralstonia pseudosolanacearum TaxID=1310165 RepID=UPI0008FCDA73|nr:hypothetical protein [Ralstonia pseudosolanacearum]APC69252.1 hypothetical protein RSOE_20250 [Ralstonia solanacearum OE1-1]NKA08599.1 hypothetical protein [Ralstonia solanacearum]API74010.1 hypothetical protein AC251_05250 [Ralstonia pseudosolanacearum]QWF62016.1 hypothetical protein KM864_05330 [Ralstonia solanacearum]TXD98837.1 hypothetical protein FUT89_06385 [Ralstonia pseudosolanacearum]